MSLTTDRFIGLQKFWKLITTIFIISLVITTVFFLKEFYTTKNLEKIHFILPTLPKGIEKDIKVTFRGIDVGKVKNVTYNEDLTHVRVDVLVVHDIAKELKDRASQGEQIDDDNFIKLRCAGWDRTSKKGATYKYLTIEPLRQQEEEPVEEEQENDDPPF